MSAETILDPLSALLWLRDTGADDAVLEAPVNRYLEAPEREPERKPEPTASPARTGPGERLTPRTTPGRPSYESGTARQIDAGLRPGAELDRSADMQSARALAASATSLAELRASLERFDGCPLKKSATNLVFADGNPQADLMFVGEAPGRDEDEKGLPFVGVSGQLLDRFLAALGRDRSNVYIANVLPWRPPDNREPALAEASVCLPFLMRHIELVKPKIVVALGATAARNLFDTTDGITRLRGHWRDLTAGGHTCPAMATFHPAALLRQPLNKRYVWRDLLSVMDKLESFR